MKRAELGMVVRYKGQVAEVVGIGDGRSVMFRYVGEEPCPTCGRSSFSLLEESHLFQDGVQPVETIGP